MSESRVVITAEIARALAEFRRFREHATNALEAVSAVGGKLNAVLGVVGLALSAGAIVGWIKGAIDATDAASDLSQKTGIAIKDLAGLELAYQMGGMEADALAGSQAKLSKAIVDGNEGLERLGISSKNLDGSFKSNKQMMYEIADRFAGMEDGAKKTALAMSIFGKSGADMIPMLNGGSEGMRELDEMANKLGLTLSEEAVENAGQFNDTLDLLMLGGQGVARGIAAELLPTLSSLAGSFLTAMTEGNRLKVTGQLIAGVFKAIYTLGVPVVEMFSTIGKVIGGFAAMATTNLTGTIEVLKKVAGGDFTGAWDTIKRTSAATSAMVIDVGTDIGKGWSGAWDGVVNVWTDGGNKIVDTMVGIKRQATVVGQSAAEVAKQAAAAKKEQDAQAKVLAELSGVTATYMDDLSRLDSMRQKGLITEERYIEAVTELISKQPGVKAAVEAEAKARKEAAEFEERYLVAKSAVADLLAGSVKAAEEEAKQQEELARTYGMTAQQISRVELARLEEQLAQRTANGLTLEEIATLERLIAAKQRSISAASVVTQKDAAQAQIEEWKRAAESIEQSLTDALLRGFESGKGFGANLVDTLKNMFNTMVLRPVISAIVNPVAGAVTGALGLSGTASAATGSGGLGGAGLGALGAAAGSLFGAGGLAGSVMAGAGWLTGATTLSGSLAAAGSLAATGTLGGIASSIGMVAGALGPIALGIGAAVAIWKKFDTSGTSHTGGASSASSTGISTIRAESLGFQHTKVSNDVNNMTGQLAAGIVGILDSTALAFGKTAGYTAATAFADDTSKDGAWGALVIQKMGQDILDWNDTRQSKWAPREFADGAKGQEQYLALLGRSVRTALDSIGLPAWAKTMLSGIASEASLEDLAKVVDQINATQGVLKTLGENLAGFSSMSDAAVSKLIAAAGGIESLAAGASSYFQNFYSKGERLANTSKQVGEALATVGLQMPNSRTAYRALVEQQMALGESGAPAVAMLLRMNDAFAALYPEMEAANDALRSQADIMSERATLQKELDSLTLTAAEQRAQERAALDESNRALYDQVVLQRDLKASTQAASEALQDTVERLTATRDSTTAYRDSLMLGSLSGLSPLQKYMEAQRQYTLQVQKALANPADSAAVSGAQAAATAWLTASQVVNASSAAFLGDKSKVLGDMEQLAAIAGVQMTDAQRQLSALDKQVLGISQLNETAVAIEQAIAGQGSASPVALPAFDMQRYVASSSAASDVLAAEVKALRADNAAIREVNAAVLAELRLLRTDAARHNDNLVDATEELGESITEGVGNAFDRTAYRVSNPNKVAPR